MNQPSNTRSYDLFKAIVALILLIIFIWLLLKGTAPSTTIAVATTVADTSTSAPQPTVTPKPLEPSVMLTIAPTHTSLPVPTATATLAALLPTQAPTPAPTTAVLPTAVALTAAPAVTEQPTAAPTATPEPTAVPTPTPEPTAAVTQVAVDCPLARPTRLKVGDTARVMSNLNMRAAPGIGEKLILTNLTGTLLKIIGGPVCEPYQNRAYLWWQVSREDGQTGWSAEASLIGNLYFLQPVQ